jgi:hypothetical protein
LHPSLKKLVSERPKTTAAREKQILKIVRKLLGASVPVGFQYHDAVVQFERETRFPTGDAMATLIREERSNLFNRERAAQKEKVERLICKIASVSTEEELLKKCYDVSLPVAAMIEGLGIRAVVYMGSLLIENEDTGEGDSLYFLNDMFNPPKDSYARGHSWIFTSAFSVIDLTAKFQPSFADKSRLRIPSPVLIENSPVMAIQEKWYFGKNEAEEVKGRKRDWLASNGFPAWNEANVNQHRRDTVSLYYMPMRTAFSDAPIQSLKTAITFGGRTPYEFLQDFKMSESESKTPLYL